MAQDVIVLAGLDETIASLQAQNWWGEEKHGEQLTVPRTMIAGISKQWRDNAPTLPVSTKKEIFYRFMLPLVVHANAMVVDRRERLQRLADTIKAGDKLTIDDDTWLREIAVVLRITDRDQIKQVTDTDALTKVIDQALYKLDVIPAGLVLGQAAYVRHLAVCRGGERTFRTVDIRRGGTDSRAAAQATGRSPHCQLPVAF
ncbi:uncharacterized protein Dvar_17820 [Desulfosarcina variabilis str. Montpellier]